MPTDQHFGGTHPEELLLGTRAPFNHEVWPPPCCCAQTSAASKRAKSFSLQVVVAPRVGRLLIDSGEGLAIQLRLLASQLLILEY